MEHDIAQQEIVAKIIGFKRIYLACRADHLCEEVHGRAEHVLPHPKRYRRPLEHSELYRQTLCRLRPSQATKAKLRFSF